MKKVQVMNQSFIQGEYDKCLELGKESLGFKSIERNDGMISALEVEFGIKLEEQETYLKNEDSMKILILMMQSIFESKELSQKDKLYECLHLGQYLVIEITKKKKLVPFSIGVSFLSLMIECGGAEQVRPILENFLDQCSKQAALGKSVECAKEYTLLMDLYFSRIVPLLEISNPLEVLNRHMKQKLISDSDRSRFLQLIQPKNNKKEEEEESMMPENSTASLVTSAPNNTTTNNTPSSNSEQSLNTIHHPQSGSQQQQQQQPQQQPQLLLNSNIILDHSGTIAIGAGLIALILIQRNRIYGTISSLGEILFGPD